MTGEQNQHGPASLHGAEGLSGKAVLSKHDQVLCEGTLKQYVFLGKSFYSPLFPVEGFPLE